MQARSRFFAALRMTDRKTRATAKEEADSFASLRNDSQKSKDNGNSNGEADSQRE
jgi:hypothetical protein